MNKIIFFILILPAMIFSGSIIKLKTVAVEGMTVTKTETVTYIKGNEFPDTVIKYDTIKYCDSVRVMCTYVDTLLLIKADTLKQTGVHPIPFKQLLSDRKKFRWRLAGHF